MLHTALSSISQIAHVDIVSRTAGSPIGYKLSFEQGRPVGDLKAMASNLGTIVTARELFYNYGQRKNSLQSAHQEYNLIHEIVSLYSLNNLPVAFTLTKVGAEPDLASVPGLSLMQRISMVIGSKVASNLTDIHVTSTNPKYTCTGVVGDLNSCLKTYRFVFFVNGRLVDCQPLKKSLETVYRTCLPKGSCAFVLLSLNIDCAILDVNIHPTKKEVRFLYEDEIVGQITSQLEQVLSQSKQSNLTTSGSKKPMNISIACMKLKENGVQTVQKTPVTTTPRQSTLVREDHRNQRIDDSFRQQQARNDVGQAAVKRTMKLTSLQELKAAVIHECDPKLKQILTESSLVGCLNAPNGKGPIVLIQFQQYLLQIDLTVITEQLFYWLVLGLFGNMAEMNVKPQISLIEMLQIAIRRRKEREISKQRLHDAIAGILSRSEMLFDYFSLKIEEDHIHCLPILIQGYIPDWKKLPDFVYELAFNVNWKKEKLCFEMVAKALAKFYSVTADSVDRETISGLIYPQIKKYVRPDAKLQSAVFNLSSVPTLYRAFKRC